MEKGISYKTSRKAEKNFRAEKSYITRVIIKEG